MTPAHLALGVLWWTSVTSSAALFAFLRTRPVDARAAGIAFERVLLLRPCAGAEPRLEEALRSSEAVPPEVVIRFLVADEADPAASTALAIAADLRAVGRDAKVIVTGACAANKKADQLARALAGEVEADVVVVLDSDVRLTRSLFGRLIASIGAGADAAWAPPIEIEADGAAARASARVLDASLHAFSLLAGIDPGGMVGKAMIVRRRALDRVGGFAASVDRLGEDMFLARSLRDSGHRVESVREPAHSLAHHLTFGDVVRRYARWLAVIRSQRPWLLPSYPLLLAAAPLQLTLATYALLRTSSWLTGAAVFTVVVARGMTTCFARMRSHRAFDGKSFATAWLADIVLLGAFAVALTTRRLRWRGSRLRLAHGRIFEDAR